MLKHLLYSQDNIKMTFCLAFIIWFIILLIVSKKVGNNPAKAKAWKCLCLVPLAAAIIHFFVFSFGDAVLPLLEEYGFIYASAVLTALLPLFYIKKSKKPVKIIGAVVTGAVCLLSLFFNIDSSVSVNYSNRDLKSAYISLCDYFEENYIMNEWKKPDYEKIKTDGLKLIDEAEKTGDITKYYEAVDEFTNSFYDGHMSISFYDGNDYLMTRIKQFNDYGLSLITLDDGTTIAVDVEDGLEIKNGDTVTKWNGVPIDQAIESVNVPMPEPVSENDRIDKAFWLACMGGESVEVSYINSDNEEKTLTLDKLDSEMPRALKARRLFWHNTDEAYSYKMLNGNTGYMKITSEETDRFHDYLAYCTGNHNYAREMFRNDLRELKNQGMTKLVVDIRNNGGGYDEVATAFASLFTKEKMYAYSLGIRKNGEYIKTADRYVSADGEFSDIEVLVLTNMRCASAGDGMVLYLSRLDNVTVAGLSCPAGCNQESGGSIFMPKGIVVNFPVGLVLDEEANPNIDVDYSRQSRTPLDVKIPLTKEAALEIFNEENFDNGKDYELEWAIDFLDGQ
ncbi:C-terminal processing protease CtpA/Prc, contains a PDZ domain [Eubacterium ruminantium]|uniref:C-terminal processing protease CtpA/Prc, contains a PDZ domain n=2 Tax=Eubacterium ruminantium TaxID=42322 RepID=A0A1T4P8P1_9FIRM|nr:C-terminal processing protease CtpA/Prc, contains a PDZ domain [Eubacterium ruminantium]SDM96945.1 C-terminal processing protease CtpA/Prc, contains a PDZ domain [Eubacterium ruminantium]SJZ87842.1 C-terminal processing protease CtpA/Prc, contains a PDZ domain [Eubacterium ruminantium]